MFRGVTETESMFRPKPNPKPKGVLVFRQNRISAKMAEIRPKAETESVSVVHYSLFFFGMEKHLPSPMRARVVVIPEENGEFLLFSFGRIVLVLNFLLRILNMKWPKTTYKYTFF